MRRLMRRFLPAVSVLPLLLAGCNGEMQVSETRHAILPVVNGKVDVSGTNGSIEVVGENRPDIALEAKVQAQGSSHSDAESLLRDVRIVTDGGDIHAEGPKLSGWFHGSWSVSYSLHVPQNVDVQLHSVNGPVSVTHLAGGVDAGTTNGGITLHGIGGEVHANTVNGAIEVALEGNPWHGAGVSAHTVNGGISLEAPDQLSAHLVVKTVNGGISVGYPVTVQGRIKHELDTNIGQGGPTVQLETVNGGVEIARSGSKGTDGEE